MVGGGGIQRSNEDVVENLDAKLRTLKVILKTWNKEVFGLIETKKEEALSQVVY